jgi:hypothetical protein
MPGALEKFTEATQRSGTVDDVTKQSIYIALTEIWQLLFPETPIDFSSKEGRENMLWKSIGFQNKDPMSDIRGSGLMGVKQLLYMLQTYPDRLKELIQKHKPRENTHYPVAAAGFSITIALTKITDIGES